MNDLLYCCRIQDQSLDPDLVTELLAALPLTVSSWREPETGTVWHQFYADTEDEAQVLLRRLQREARRWREFGVKLGAADVTPLRREDWSESWKAHFPVQHISPRLVIKPSWRDYVATPGKIVIELDPGMSFGT